MTNSQVKLLEQAEALLRPLQRKVVFIGGASVAVHLDDLAVRTRSTTDVDFVVEATSYSETAQIEEELRSHGFTQNLMDVEPICRWHKDGLTLDMVPTDPEVLGFGASQ